MLKFNWYGTNSFKLYDQKTSILFDPFIRYDKIDNIEYKNNFTNDKNIFITHGHIDHILHIPKLYKNRTCKIYCLNIIYKRLNKRGLTNKQLIKINYDDNIKIDDFDIKVYKSKHIKFDLKLILKTLFSVDIFKHFKNLLYLCFNHIKNPLKNSIAAYEIRYDNLKIFVMGSMNLDNNTIYPKNMDYLILAYQGRSDLDIKINTILERLNPKKVILTHFDNSFPPISKSVDLTNIKKNNKIIIPEYEKEIILQR